MRDFEELGLFYLGRRFDRERGAATEEPYLLPARDLTTHAVCVGMTGSGKTGLGISLLEEAAIDGIPALAIDPKGDLGNLALAFPQLRPEDFAPWIDPDEARRAGKSPDEQAKATAERWRAGLAASGQDGARVARFAGAAEVAIYTPGSRAGLPLSLLRSFAPPPPALAGDADAIRERAQAAVSGLLALLGREADPLRSREHILLARIVAEAWERGAELDLPGADPRARAAALRARRRARARVLLSGAGPLRARRRAQQPARLAGVRSVARGRPARRRPPPPHGGRAAAPRGAVDRAPLRRRAHVLRHPPPLRGRGVDARAAGHDESLRALLYMDEVFGYFPPTANPPSKVPLLTLLKQARAFGVGVVLATQNPVDLDYKALGNAARGSSAGSRPSATARGWSRGSGRFRVGVRRRPRADSSAQLGGLEKRVFLAHDVRETRRCSSRRASRSPTSAGR